MSIKYCLVKNIFLFLLFIFIICDLNGNNKNNSELYLELPCVGSGEKIELIDAHFSEPFLLETLTFSSDVYFQEAEFLYLVGLQKGSIITCADLKNAFYYLKQKNKFDKVCISVKDGSIGKILHFNLIGFWTFANVKLTGIWFDKEKLAQNYLLEPDEPFDIEKHKHSLLKIKKVLNNQGYFNAKIDENLIYEQSTKSICVNLHITKETGFVIGDINFIINKEDFIEDSEIISFNEKIKKLYFKRFMGRGYNKKSLDNEKKILKKYLKNNGFPFSIIELEKQINYHEKKINLIVKISLQKKREWKFSGNKHFSDSKLLEFILADERFLMPISILSQEIAQHYKNLGFWQVCVNGLEDKNFYKLEIQEGERAIVEKIEIKKINKFTPKFIINKFFKSFLKSKYYNKELEIQCIDNLTAFYLKHGFWDISINKNFIQIGSSNKYILELIIDEGAKRLLKSVSIENNKDLETEGPFAALRNLKKPIPFDINSLNEQRRWLIDYFQKKGCSDVVVNHEFSYECVNEAENENISLTWKVLLGNSGIKFGRTILRGSGKFPFQKILREIQYDQGDIWKKEKIEDTFFRFNELGSFRSINLYPSATFDYNGNKPVILKLFPDDQFEVRTRIGFQGVSRNLAFIGAGTYRFGGSFIYKNPFDLGDQFKIDTDFTMFQQDVMAQYKIPWLFNMPIKTIFQAYDNKYKQPLFIGSKKNLYEITQRGFLIDLIRKFNKNISLGINYGIEEIKISDLKVNAARAIDFSIKLLDKKMPYFFIEPNIIIDTLDNKLNPSGGFLTVFSSKILLSLKNNKTSILKFIFDHSCFKSIFNSVIAIRLRAGHIFSEKFINIVPSERFYLGGPNSLRSFEPDLAPPLGCFEDDCGEKQFAPQGGITMLNLNFEIRVPLFNQIGIVLFEDLGVLLKDNAQKIKLLTATGLGLRYNTPIGPLRLDVGWRPKDSNNDSFFTWFLTLGHAF